MLTEFKRNEISALYDRFKNFRKVAEIAHVGYCTVVRVVKKVNRKTGKKVGRHPVITKREKTRLKRYVRAEIASGRLVNSRIIRDELNLTASRSSIRREMQRQNFNYEIVKKQLPLTHEHRQARMDFAEKHIRESTNFEMVIFSDEKRFSLDGPDNMGSYVEHRGDLVIAPSRIKRQMGGGGVMVLGAISSAGNVKIRFIEGKYKACNYLDDLRNIFIPWCKSQFPRKKWIWQQDNSSIHTAGIVEEFLEKKKIATLTWPARSPDLNIIENVWHLLELEIYQDRQYKTREELISAIQAAAQKIRPKVIHDLFKSIPGRLLNVVKANGATIN